MNPNTGAIAKFENAKDAIAAGFTLKLTAEQAAQLMPLPRKARLAAMPAPVKTKSVPRFKVRRSRSR